MNSFKIPLRLRLKVAFNGLRGVLFRPLYAALFFLSFWFTLGLLVWLTNWSLLFNFLTSGSSSLLDKLVFFLAGYTSLVTNFSLISAVILITFAVLSALNTVLIIFVVTKSFKEALASGTKNIISVLAAAVGAGCAACGTSFLAPLLTGVSGAASITLTMAIGVIANFVGLILLIYSVILLGSSAATFIAKKI